MPISSIITFGRVALVIGPMEIDLLQFVTMTVSMLTPDSEPEATSAATQRASTQDAGTCAVPVCRQVGPSSPVQRLRRGAWPTLKYLTQTEVHTYAFSVAANAILSLIPFFVLMATLTRNIFHSRPMTNAVFQLLESSLPMWSYSDKMFIVRNLRALVEMRLTHGIQLMSLVMLLISSTGIFEPLEVALNKVWGFSINRPYWKNQLVSLALAFGCGALALISVALTGGAQALLAPWFPAHLKISLLNRLALGTAWVLTWLILNFFALLASIFMFFFIYWLLPNGKVKARQVFPAAIVVGILLETAKYVYMLVLPLLAFRDAYGPFYLSVTLIFWAFAAGMLLLGGAYLSAAGKAQSDPEPAVPERLE